MNAPLYSKIQLRENELLSKHTTLKIGGPALYYSEPETIPQRNIEFARRQGPEKMRKMLDSCLSPKK